MTISSQMLCFEARRKCGVGCIHTQLASSYANAPQQLASSPSTVGFITCDFHALISRQFSQTNRRGLHTLFLTSKSRCMQKISPVDALLTAQNVLSWSGRFGGSHTGWSQLQLASSVSPLCVVASLQFSNTPPAADNMPSPTLGSTPKVAHTPSTPTLGNQSYQSLPSMSSTPTGSFFNVRVDPESNVLVAL